MTDDSKSEPPTGDRRKSGSISKIMEGSDERLDSLRTILTHLSVDEKEAAARMASAVALANIVHDEVVIAADVNQQIVYTNSTVTGLLGYEPDELIGKPTTILIPESYREQHTHGFTRYIDSGEKRFSEWRNVPLIVRHKDGTEVNVSVSFEDVQVLGHRMIVAVIRRIDEAISDRVINKVADKVMEKVAASSDGVDPDGH